MPSEYPCDQAVPVEQEPCHQLVFQNEFVRAFGVEIGPQGRTLCHRHDHEYLTYIATIANIVDTRENRPPETHLLHDGECMLSPAGVVHVVQNLGDTSFRNLVVELLPKCNELRRGRWPVRKLQGRSMGDSLVGEGAHMRPELRNELGAVRPCFEEERICVHLVDVNRTVVGEVFGPALIASPYGGALEIKRAGEAGIQLREFREVGWLPPDAIAVVQGRGGRSGRAVVFCVGRSQESFFPVQERYPEPLADVPNGSESGSKFPQNR